MSEMSNPYAVFFLSPDISFEEVKASLLPYQEQIELLCKIYDLYFSKVGIRSRQNNVIASERTENLLARKYELGFDLSKTLLDEKEIDDLLSKVVRYNEQFFKNNKKEQQVKNIDNIDEDKTVKSQDIEEKEFFTLPKAEKNMRLELFDLAFSELEELRKSFRKVMNSNQEDFENMLDLLISLRYKSQLANIATSLARDLSSNGIVQSREEFLETFKSTKKYQQLRAMYKQISTQEKRSELIPEFYVRKNMADISQFSTISVDTVERLLSREKNYEREYIDSMIDSYLDSEKRKNNEVAENQKHDYGWGIVLTPPQRLIDNEPVRTPIFNGRITVDKIGAFSEHSLFRKRQYEREYTVKVRQRAKVKHGLFQKKLERVPTQKVMRECYYKHEACKELSDNIWRVTKTDTQGRSTTYIIFSPLESVGRKGSDLSNFIKNVYLSDYMLQMAQINGGYAGRVMQNDNGFFISNKYNYEEIASAILFQHGQKGNILDSRDVGKKEQYEDVKKDTFLELISQEERTRNFDE